MTEIENKNTGVLFRINDYKFFLENRRGSRIKQIVRTLIHQPVANCPDYITSLYVYENVVCPVINLERLLKINEPKDQNAKFFYIIIDYRNKSFVIQVDEIIRSIDIDKSKIPTYDLMSIYNNTLMGDLVFNEALLINDNMYLELDTSFLNKLVSSEMNTSREVFLSDNRKNITLKELSKENLKKFNIDFQKDLDTRPLISTIRRTKAEKEATKISGLLLSLGTNNFLIPERKIIEINRRIPTIYSVPNNDRDFILGIMSYRGKLIEIIDLKLMLIGEQTFRSKANRLIILEVENDNYALLVESVHNVIKTSITNFRKPNGNTLENLTHNEIFDGTVLYENMLILSINAESILKTLENKNVNFGTSSIYVPHVDMIRTVQTGFNQDIGLVVEIDSAFFYLEPEFIVQIHDQNNFVSQNFDSKYMKGVAVYNSIVPLVDTEPFITETYSEQLLNEKLKGILLKNPITNHKVEIIVDRIVGRISRNDFEVFSQKTDMNPDLTKLNHLGYFVFQNQLGIILDTAKFIEEIYETIKSDFKFKNDELKIENLLNQSNKEIAESILAAQQAYQELLISDYSQDRYDVLIFSYKNNLFGIDIDSIVNVNSFENVEFETNIQPDKKLLGIAKEEDKKYQIFDLFSQICKTEVIKEIIPESLFILFNSNLIDFCAPVKNILSVETIYEGDLQPIQDNESINEKYNISEYKFSIEESITNIYLLKPNFLELILKDNNQIKKL